MNSFIEYLKPTRLCDFDRNPEIKEKALQLSGKQLDKQQVFNHISHFVKELPYGLDDWDVSASQTLTLRKGWGMCSGKTNLLVAMLRLLSLPVRYRICKIEPEQELWKWLAEQDEQLASQLGIAPPEQDHVEAEVYLNGWKAYDPSRDSAFEEGLRKLGIPLERKPVTHVGGSPQSIILASIDEWMQNRQRARRFRQNRELVFSMVNEQLDKIRLLGKR